MEKISQSTPLLQRLQEKIAADQTAIAQTTSDSLLKYGEALESAWKAALNSTEKELMAGLSGTASRLSAQMETRLRSAKLSANRITQSIQAVESATRRLLLWSSLVICLIAIALLGAMASLAWMAVQKANLQMEIDLLKKTQEALSSQNDGFQIIDTPSGRFLLIPPAATGAWMCGSLTCLRLPSQSR